MGITSEEFTKAVVDCGFESPPSDVYQYFDLYTSDFSRNELAMFLAQLIHESGGFQFKEEIAYADKRNHGQYRDNHSLPGKDYHGRGYIQLTWAQNYKDASRDLGMGDELLKRPERVAKDTEMAMLVSVWYWRTKVRRQLGSKFDCFGLTTKAINGAIECSNGYNETAAKRYQYYLKVADALGIQNKASERGCYN
ncbi:endochitinase At2g43620-like [Ischnura elegans]|uniref:endochitinase At2g43620-like n=1 Tax=Ischnura elegans TaxID=197161 RepID=UPI001ED8B698|nr:endochitinase At2g43620-like [Ischnura elegans]